MDKWNFDKATRKEVLTASVVDDCFGEGRPGDRYNSRRFASL